MSGDTIQVLPYICEGRGGELYRHIVPSTTVHHRHTHTTLQRDVYPDIFSSVFIVQYVSQRKWSAKDKPGSFM